MQISVFDYLVQNGRFPSELSTTIRTILENRPTRELRS